MSHAPSAVQPSASLQPGGQLTKAGAEGQLAEGAHSTSHAHDDSQRTPPLQLPVAAHAIEQGPVPQLTPNPQLSAPSHETEQLGASPHAIEPHESRAMQRIAQGPLPQVAPKKQLRSPSQSTSQLEASAHCTSLMQPCVRAQRTRQGMPAGQMIGERSSPRI